MRLFTRNSRRDAPPLGRLGSPEPAAGAGEEIRVSRTLVKSEPELAELVAADPRLGDDAIGVTPSEKGFGTRVAISAAAGSGLGQGDLEQLLDQLAEPQKRPFSGG